MQPLATWSNAPTASTDKRGDIADNPGTNAAIGFAQRNNASDPYVFQVEEPSDSTCLRSEIKFTFRGLNQSHCGRLACRRIRLSLDIPRALASGRRLLGIEVVLLTHTFLPTVRSCPIAFAATVLALER